MNEDTKNTWIKFGLIALISFLSAFLAFYIVMEIMIHRITSPEYNIRKIEKIIQKNNRAFAALDKDLGNNPFEPKMRPMFVNLVKENDKYQIIVDLKAIDLSEENVKVNLKDKLLTVSGEIEKKAHNSEKMINFSNSFYLDEDIKPNQMTKERKGDRYIITVPFED